MKTLEVKKNQYIQPKTEIIEMEYQTYLLDISGGSQEGCAGDECGGNDDCPSDCAFDFDCGDD